MRAGRVMTSNAVSARAVSTDVAPVGNSSRRRWSLARLSTDTAKATRGDPASSVASMAIGIVTVSAVRPARSVLARSWQRQLELDAKTRAQRTAADAGDGDHAGIGAGEAAIGCGRRIVVFVADIAAVLDRSDAVIRDAGRLVADLERAVMVDRQLDPLVLGIRVAAVDEPAAAGTLRVGGADGEIERGVAARAATTAPTTAGGGGGRCSAHGVSYRLIACVTSGSSPRIWNSTRPAVRCGDAGDRRLARPERDRSIERLRVELPPRLGAVHRQIDECVDDLRPFDRVGVHDDRSDHAVG